MIRLLDRLTRRDAETEGRRIIEEANRDADNRKKEAELEIKEMAIQQKAEGEKELGQIRQELHERERLLDKRQDAVEQQAEQLRKQEKMVETTQRKLAERIEDTNRRNEELQKLLDLQRQTLHQLSGLSREEATRRLLEMLDQRIAARARRHHPEARTQDARNLRGQIARNSGHRHSALRRQRTPPKPPPAPSIFPTTK